MDVNCILTFLTRLYELEASYSALNSARSALSAFVVLPSGETLGNNPLVSRFLKGVFNLRTPKPRYSEIWDVKPVLLYLRKLSPVKMLSLKDLTLKVCTLLALLTAQRAQTLKMLRIDAMQDRNNKFVFFIDEKLKQSRPGNVGAKVELNILLTEDFVLRLC